MTSAPAQVHQGGHHLHQRRGWNAVVGCVNQGTESEAIERRGGFVFRQLGESEQRDGAN